MIPHSKPTFGLEEKRALVEVLESGQLAQGGKVEEFEKVFCNYTGRNYAVAVSSGTVALSLSLLILRIGPQDEVILPSFTCAALLHAVESVGARPILVDIDPRDFSLSVAEAKKKIGRRTKAVIVPHLFGGTARIEELADSKLAVIEDGTQSLGACIGKRKVGAFGIISVFSFYATKMIATGEGGMVLTDSRALAEDLRDKRDYDKKADHRFRTNSKMTDLEAALGIEQMKKLPDFVAKRRKIALRYHSLLKNSDILPPSGETGSDPVYYRYVVRVPNGAESWIQRLNVLGIEAKQPVYKPLHQYLGLSDREFPETVCAMKEACSLPIFPSLTEEEFSRVAQAVQQIPAAFSLSSRTD